jgi:hypothetical protein
MSKFINTFTKVHIDPTEPDNTNTEDYYTSYIPDEVDKIITEKMYFIVRHDDNKTEYNTPDECDAMLMDLSTKIKYGNYDIILSKLLKQYEIYCLEFYMCYNLDIVSIMFRVLTREYYKFIKFYMKHDLAKHEYDTESDETILNKMISYKKKEERKKYKNLTITVPVYIPPYRYNTRPKV